MRWSFCRYLQADARVHAATLPYIIFVNPVPRHQFRNDLFFERYKGKFYFSRQQELK